MNWYDWFSEPSCKKSDFIILVVSSIQRYAVIPLSTNSGLIGWVPHCDTLHALIRDYREKKKILLNIEHRIMLRVRPQQRIQRPSRGRGRGKVWACAAALGKASGAASAPRQSCASGRSMRVAERFSYSVDGSGLRPPHADAEGGSV